MTQTGKSMNKTLFDFTAGFSMIGLFNGFFDKLSQLHFDWAFILQAVLIQVLVIVFRLAFSSFWKKYGKKWVGLSSLLLPVLILFVSCSTPKFTGTIGAPYQPDPVSADSIPAQVITEPPVPADPVADGTGSEVFHGSSDQSRPESFKLKAGADTVIHGTRIRLNFTYDGFHGWFSFLDVRPPDTVFFPVELKQDASGYRVSTPTPVTEPSWYESHPVEVVTWSVLSGILLGAGMLSFILRRKP